MMGKTVFIFQLLLIIIFSNFSLCIRNEGNIYNSEGRNRQNIIRFSAEDALIPITDPTAGNVQQAQPNKAQDKFTFSSQRYQYSVNNPQDTTKNFGRRKYVDPSITSRQRGTPPNALFNTGEHYQSSSNYYNRRPSSNYHRPYGGQYESNAVDTDNVVTNYQSYGDNPNYFQDNYAHNYNYPGNKRPNYNLRATPPPRPPPVPSQSPYPYDYPYQPQYDQSGRPPPPYPYPHPESIQQQSPYDYPSYASLFNNFQAFSNPLTSLFSGFTGGGRPSNPLGSQITKALENISANDDLNCVPKLLCQMIGNPERRAELPGFLTAPAITSLIAALPVASPALVYGRAALLGFTGGEESCESTYNKCPSNEDDLLYYLNNHRGGFFRFFNGGESFSEVSSNFQDPQSQYTGSRPQSQYTGSRPQSTYSGSNQGALQSLSDSASPAGGGFNLLGSLASFFLPGFQSTSSGSDGLVSVVGNLLGGLLVGQQRTKSKKVSKRSIDVVDPIDDINTKEPNDVLKADEKVQEEPKTNDATYSEDVGASIEDELEGRILNYKRGILSESNNYDSLVRFPFDDQSNYADNYRYGKDFDFEHYKNQDINNYERYPPYNDVDERPYRGGKQISFKDENDQDSDRYYPSSDYNRYQNDNERPHQVKMVFPDRTGTGNLRFDNSDFDRDRDRDQDRNRHRDYVRYPDRVRDRDQYNDDNRDYNRDRYSNRYGKILNRPNYSKYETYYDYDEYYNKRKPYYPSNTHKNDYTNSNRYEYTTTRRPYYNRYETTTRRPIYNDDYYGNNHLNRYPSSSSSRPSGGEGYIYVTNSKGVVDHYIKPNGQKVYV